MHTEEIVKVPVIPGRRVWTVSRGEIYPMKVHSVLINENGIYISIVYDGDDPFNKNWNITCLTEKDIGYYFFLTKGDAEKFLNDQLKYRCSSMVE